MKKRIFATLLALVMALGLTVTAAADDLPAVSYIDPTKPADQQTQTCTTYTTVTSDTTTWNTGWYVVSGDVTINNSITVKKDVNLILMDGKTLTVDGIQLGGTGTAGISTGNLRVYGQSAGETAGKLICRNGMKIERTANESSNVILNSGTVCVDGVVVVGQNGTDSSCTLTVNGGTLNVGGGITVEASSMSSASLTVTGGTVTVTNSSGDAIRIEGHSTPGTMNITGGTVIAKSTKDGGRAINRDSKFPNISPNLGNLELPTAAYWWRTVECGDYTKFVDDTTAYTPGNEAYAEITTQANPVNTNAHTGGAWQLDSSSHWKVCAACGGKYDEASHDGSPCTVCGYEQPAHQHTRRQPTTAATTDTAATADTTIADEAKTDTVTSAKTFDAGVAVYGAMAIVSLLGMGYVGKKRV